MELQSLKWLVLALAAVLCVPESGLAQRKSAPGKSAPGKIAPGKNRPQSSTNRDADEQDSVGGILQSPAEGAPISPLEHKVRAAQNAYSAQDFEECIKLTTEVLKEDPRHAVARYHRASALIDLGRLTQDNQSIRAGIADAREALAVAGNQHLIFHIPYFYGLTSLAEVENRKSHADLAVNIAGTLLQRENLAENVRGMVYFQRGLAKVYLKDFNGAAADYSSALEIDPRFQAAHFGRADAYAKAGDIAKARTAYDRAVSTLSTDPLAYNNRGTFLLQQGKIDLAIADFSKALELEPQFAMAALNRGYAYGQKLAWPEAEANYVACLALDPEQPLALRLLGVARANQGKLKQAIDDYSTAISLDAEDPENYSGRGFTRFFAKNYAGAAADFSKTLQLNAEFTMVVPWRCVAQVRSGQEAAAKQELEAFIAARPKTPNWHVYLGQYVLGELDDQQLLAITKNTSDLKAQKQWLCEAYYFQGLQSQAAGQTEIAKKHFTECVKTQQNQLMAYLGARFGLAAK